MKKNNVITLKGQKNLYAFNYDVSSDPSSASFLVAFCAASPFDFVLFLFFNFV